MPNQNKLQEMQILEQNLQSLLMQKQTFQIELRETQSALDELGKSGDEVFKIVGQLMVKSDKDSVNKELKKKKELLELRMKTLDKQEKSLSEKLESIRNEIMGSVDSSKSSKQSKPSKSKDKEQKKK